MVLKFIVGLTILELLIKRWKKIVLDNTTVSQKASKTTWPTGNSYAFLGFQAFIFTESESYHSPTLSLTAS